MNIPPEARYTYCCNKAASFILSENLASLPFDSDVIMKRNDWTKIKYSNLAERNNISIEDCIRAYQSKDGYSIFNEGYYYIAYNDTTTCKQRIYFTKLHEIGHIYLNHFIDFEKTKLFRSSLNESEYKVIENEANCFARNVLAPAVLVKKLGLDTPSDVSKKFKITPKAAETRLNFLESDLWHLSPEYKVRQLIFFNNFLYNKVCKRCNHSFISKFAYYCPVCGFNKLVTQYNMEENYMYYNDGYDLDSDSRAKRCPICDNEDITGEFCKICGTYIINKCSENNEYSEYVCNEMADGNARYCTRCGSETTFYKNGLLKDWKDNRNSLENRDNTKYILFEKWPDVLYTLKNSGRMMLATYLASTSAYLEKNELTISFPKETASLKNNMNKPEHIEALKEVVRTYSIYEVKFTSEEDFNT